MSKIPAIIPSLNAEHTLREVIRATRPLVDLVVVVDDGSDDATSDVARSEGATVLRHEVNRGKGAALRTGFEYLLGRGYEAVITLDADGQHLPAMIPAFVEAHERDPRIAMIIGSRDHLFGEMLPRRRNANRFSAWAISKFAGVRVPDSQSGFRLYTAHMLRSVHFRADRFDAESEMIVRAGRRGLRIVSIPIELGFVNGLHTSHYRAFVDTVRIFWTVVKTALSTRRA